MSLAQKAQLFIAAVLISMLVTTGVAYPIETRSCAQLPSQPACEE